MTEQVRFKPGDRVHVWLSNQWVRCKVLGHRHWSHDSGNSFVAYRVETAAGNQFECSANSIREYAG